MILLNLNLTLLLWRINRAEQKMLIDGKYQMVGNAHPEDFVFQFLSHHAENLELIKKT